MKDVKGYEGLYAVTSCGRVWSYKSKKFLKPHLDKHGYQVITLSSNGKLKSYFIHRLVAIAYIPNPDGLPQINHKDEVKTHNYVNNLEWCDSKYNNNYGKHNERMGDAHGRAVVCEELDTTYKSMAEAARQLNLHSAAISMCCSGKIKTSGGYHWHYAN